jgi:hypothetical protein
MGLFSLLSEILSVDAGAASTTKLRLRLIDKTVSWQALVDLADAQSALSPFVWSLLRRSLPLPLPMPALAAGNFAADHPAAQLSSAQQQFMTRRGRQRDQLAAIVAALNRENIEPLLLKGARYLAAPPDSWAAARDMRDIDLLVPVSRAERAVEVLVALGYAAATAGIPIDHHLPEMTRAGEPSVVEIHTEALAFSARKILSTEEVWRRANRLSTDLGAFFVLPDEWQLLHALLNHQISDRGHVRRILAVKPLWEFAMLGGEVTERGWRVIAEHMAARGHADILGSFIVQAARLYGLPYPPGVEISPGARAHAAATMANAVAPDWLRRGSVLADEFRFAFARETLAVRYKLDPPDVSLATIGRHVRFLARHYRGRLRTRVFGRRRRP